jgi:hypothetical protein
MRLVVYHIYCFNDYKNIFIEQLARFLISGLYEWCDVVEVTAIGNEKDFEYLDSILKIYSKISLNFYKDNKQEFYAINKIWEYSQKNEGVVLYFHTKGVWNNFTNTENKEVSELKNKSVHFWREIMEYFLIDQYKACLNELQNFDHCGVTCNSDTGVNGYWGNFWWCNLSYIRANPKLSYINRWSCEAWLNKNRRYKAFEFFHFEYNPYFTCLPSDIYKNVQDYKNNIPKIKSAFYGTLGIQMDENWPISEKLLIDVTDKIKIKGLVNNEYFGFDPCFGLPKNLIINFEYKKDNYFITFNENENYNLEKIIIMC